MKNRIQSRYWVLGMLYCVTDYAAVTSGDIILHAH